MKLMNIGDVVPASKNIEKMKNEYVRWFIDIEEDQDFAKAVGRADDLFEYLPMTSLRIRRQVAHKLIGIKKEYYAEDITVDDFARRMRLSEVIVCAENICLEYLDGELFNGRRIRVHIDDDAQIIKVSI